MRVGEGTWGRGRDPGLGEERLGVYARSRGVRTARLDLTSQPDKGFLVLSPAQSARSPAFRSLLCCRLEPFFMAYSPVQFNCPGHWGLPSSSTGRRSSLLQTWGAMLLYFEKDPYPEVQTPDKMSYFLY